MVFVTAWLMQHISRAGNFRYTVIESNEDNFQILVLLMALGFASILAGVLQAIKRFCPTRWPRIHDTFIMLDKFNGDHYFPEEELDETMPKPTNKRIEGALATIVSVIVVTSMVGLFLFNFFCRNFVYSEALVPRDESKIYKVGAHALRNARKTECND